MLFRVCVLSCLVTLALGALVAITAPTGARAAGSELEDSAILAVAPWDVSQVSLSRAGVSARVVREPSGYVLIGQQIRAPVDASRVRGAVRLLRDGLRLPTGETPSAIEPVATLALIEGDDENAKAWTLEIGDLGVGGRALVRVTAPDRTDRIAEADNELVRALLDDGLEGWRDPKALSGLERWLAEAASGGGGPSRLTIATRSGEVQLLRVGSRWRLIEPHTGPADSETVTRVIGRLSQIAMQPRIVDEDFSPLATVTVEGEPIGEAGAGDERLTLEIGPQTVEGWVRVRVSASRKVRAADGQSTSRTLWGPLEGIIEAASLQQIESQAIAYADRVACERRPGEITVVRIDGQTLVRQRDGWSRGEDGSGPPLGATGGQAVRQLLEVLASERASTIRPEQPEGYRRLAGVELARRVESVGEIRAGVYEIGLIGDAQSAFFVVSDSRLVRIYPLGDRRAMLALLSELGRTVDGPPVE